jgi:hypothetical protein
MATVMMTGWVTLSPRQIRPSSGAVDEMEAADIRSRRHLLQKRRERRLGEGVFGPDRAGLAQGAALGVGIEGREEEVVVGGEGPALAAQSRDGRGEQFPGPLRHGRGPAGDAVEHLGIDRAGDLAVITFRTAWVITNWAKGLTMIG